MIGIYKITNNINGKSYIGQSINILQRWKAHKNKFKTEEYPLYRAMRKYGIENFSFEIIEECSEKDLNEREIYWIKFFQSFGEKGYNLTRGGEGQRHYDIEKVINIYNKNKNVLQTARDIGCHPTTVQTIIHSFGIYGGRTNKPVEKIDPKTLQVLETYDSTQEAGIKNNLSATAVSQAASGKSVSSGGFYWRYVDDKEKVFKPIIKSWKRKVLQMDKNSNVLKEYSSLSDAARALGKTPSSATPSINAVCRGRKNSAYGYKWAYADI